MKNKHLAQALEFANRLGCIVKRKHNDGMTEVTVTDKTGTQSAAKLYKTGSSNPQAMFIKVTAKNFTLVETGVMVRHSDGSVFFLSEKFSVIYRWHPARREWLLWIAHALNADVLRVVLPGEWCKAKVNVSKLRPGVEYRD